MEVVFAAASDEARPILTGVLAKFEGEQADARGRRQLPDRRARRSTSSIRWRTASVVIPARALAELARILSDTDDPVELVLAQARNQVLFHLEGVDIVCRLIDGQFPNYQKVLPATHATRAELDREELLKAVRPAALIASSSANIVKLQVGGDDGAGVIVTATADVGDYTGDVEAAIEGDATTIAFNARYLKDVLSNVRPTSSRSSSTDRCRRACSGRSATTTTSTSSCPSGRPS